MVTVPMVVALIGLILYFWAPRPDVMEVGRICFFCGLLAALMNAATKVVV